MDFKFKFNSDAFKNGMSETYMTDEEATRLDEKWTKTPPKPGPNGTGYFTRCKKQLIR